ncbi:TM1802 family CRISPR-associated protein [Clostridium ljungdahlii]|uniref:CRISPR-associated protein n=1 Tax=Clostridium ljungdahlii (strain ATCC 55383 / DSM 13528 / PETC) TaxID=748727 RepID=D8GKL5_CLOLD|nr:TM1802 family CRISPR-associated protein [Clostridium ljungdahlii]ADK15355.1 hypothetical protein CLJU_c22970 [Clostridium ljungdahlii DSM 13528]OAA88455.1 CRISPR-associated protein [Clostridium ljungdahlii DSM 13528]
MNIGSFHLKGDIKNYLEKMKYDQEEIAMFLLGYLMGEMRNAQWKDIHKNSRKNLINVEDRESIFNKLNYTGINEIKIMGLAKEIFEKLEQGKVKGYTRAIFNELKRILDSNIKKWKMNKQENLFYVLSGYVYNTANIMLSDKKGKRAV